MFIIVLVSLDKSPAILMITSRDNKCTRQNLTTNNNKIDELIYEKDIVEAQQNRCTKN